MKKVINVTKTLETVAMLMLIFSLITGCCKVGKGVRIIDDLEKPNPYPVINVEDVLTTTANVLNMSLTTSEVTTTETTMTTIESTNVVEPLAFIAETHTNIQEDVNVDVTETSFETYDNGYYPSVANGYITEEERVFLCNTVGTEYGADWVSLYDKALVVDTVMTRVDQGCWTNGLESTVYNVLTAPNQYNPWYAEGYYHDCVTQSCIDAVEYYFQHRDEFPHYTSFYGDGVENHFYYN